MRFEVGKFYKHSGGRLMHILTEVTNCTGYSNPCLVAEEPGGYNFLPVGTDEASAVNWEEVQSHEYYQIWANANPDSKELQKLATPA